MFILLLSLGLFFTISGYNKLFVYYVRTRIARLFSSLNLPPWAATATSWGEFVCGLGLLVSIFVRTWLLPLDCALLILILLGAIATDCIHDIKARGPHGFTWITKSMMQPEVLLALMLLSIIVW